LRRHCGHSNKGRDRTRLDRTETPTAKTACRLTDVIVVNDSNFWYIRDIENVLDIPNQPLWLDRRER